MATTVIGAHTLEHMYGRGFLVLITAIYVSLGLNPIQAGLLDGVTPVGRRGHQHDRRLLC